MTNATTARAFHLTVDGASVLSHTNYDTLYVYAEQVGWMSRDQHGEHHGSGIRITQDPASIHTDMQPSVEDASDNPKVLPWREAVEGLGLWAKPAGPNETPLWVYPSPSA